MDMSNDGVDKEKNQLIEKTSGTGVATETLGSVERQIEEVEDSDADNDDDSEDELLTNGEQCIEKVRQ
jgi:hypothetical protein